MFPGPLQMLNMQTHLWQKYTIFDVLYTYKCLTIHHCDSVIQIYVLLMLDLSILSLNRFYSYV